MELALFSYAVVLLVIAALIYIFCISTRLDVGRRFSVGRLSIQRILAENGRRLSQFGQRIEQFSRDNAREAGGSVGELRRRSTSDNLVRAQKDHQEKQSKLPTETTAPTPASSTIPRIVETPSGFGLGTVVEEKTEEDFKTAHHNPESRDPDAKTTNLSTSVSGANAPIEPSASHVCKVHIKVDAPPEQRKRPNHLDVPSVNSSVGGTSNEDKEKRNCRDRRDSVMPVICDPKSLPRRKSFLPVLTEESTYGRRLSLLPPTVGDALQTGQRRRGSVLVKPPAYVCPRKSSVLFNSDIFFRSPRRKSTVSLTAPRAASAAVTKLTNGVKKSGLAGSDVDVTVGRTCRYTARRTSSVGVYPCRRKSSLAHRNHHVTAVNTVRKTLADILPDLQKAIASGGSKVKDALKAALRKNEANLPYFCQEVANGGPTSRGRSRSNYLTGNLSEYKDAFGPDAHEVLSQKYVTHGPVYEINALGQRTVFLFDHRDIDVLKKAEGRYPKHMDFKHLRLYRKRNNLPLGLLLSHGEEWKQQRNVLSKLLLGTATTIRYVPVIQQVAKEAVELIKSRRPVDTEDIYDPEKDVSNYTIEAFGRVLYGRDLKCLDDQSRTDLHHFVDIAKKNFEDAKALLTLPSCLMLLHPAWRRHNERWNFLLETTIKQVRKSILKDKTTFCVLTQLLKGGKMTEPEMLINLTDMLLASIDTTTNAIMWCLYELALDPESQTRIVEELRRHGNDAGDVTFEGLQQMMYTKAVVKETLRLHPVGFLACRTIPKGMAVRQHNVPAKANVATCMYVMGRCETLGPDMGVFRPDRWLQEGSNLPQFYHDVPFGFGPRMCIGKRVAELEIATFVIQFCHAFEFSLNPACHIDHHVKLLLVPSRPLELVLKSRSRDAA